MHFHVRHFVHAQCGVVVIVGLLHIPIFESDRAVQRSGETVADAAFHLCFDDAGVDGDAAVHHAHHAIDFECAIGLHADFGDFRHYAIKGLMQRDAAPAAYARFRR